MCAGHIITGKGLPPVNKGSGLCGQSEWQGALGSGVVFQLLSRGEALEAPAGNGQMNDNFTEERVIHHFPARMEDKTPGNKANDHIPFQREK